MRGFRALVAFSLALLSIAALPTGSAVASPQVTEFPTQGFPRAITSGPDGNLWFTQYFGNNIARITPAGVITEFPIPTANSQPVGIVTGPDGNVWFTESAGNKIGRVSASGSFVEYPLPTPGAVPFGITVGPDGNLWFVESFGFKVGRITPFGVVTEFPLPTTNSYPRAITTGPDGNLWFTEELTFKVGRITPTGTITEFPVPATSESHQGITTGPDGRLWFAIDLACSYAIGAMEVDGSLRQFYVPGTCSQPEPVLWVGKTLWFGTVINDGIWRATPGRHLDRIPTPTVDSDPLGLVLGPDGNIWFTEYFGNKIGRIEP